MHKFSGEVKHIAGASHGGYAARMGVVREPAQYRAAVSWIGPTDVALMPTYSASDIMGSLWLRDAFAHQVGDVNADAAPSRTTSPLQRAQDITRPVLPAYGERDRRLPLVHSTRLRDALKEAGKAEVEWVAYAEEGHG